MIPSRTSNAWQKKMVSPKAETENHGTLVLCPYFLEYQKVQLDTGYQAQIPNTCGI